LDFLEEARLLGLNL